MRTDDEYRQILILWEQGNDQSHIARLTEIPRGTVKDCIKRFRSLKQFNEDRLTKPKEPSSLNELREGAYTKDVGEAYAYLLGIYLGDGYINKEPRTYKLRISLDTKYPTIIKTCVKTIETLLPFNKVGIVKTQYNCVEVACSTTVSKLLVTTAIGQSSFLSMELEKSIPDQLFLRGGSS
jgi:hypothetical protein